MKPAIQLLAAAVTVVTVVAAPTVAFACTFVPSYDVMEINSWEAQSEPEFPDPVVLDKGDIKRAPPSRLGTDMCSRYGTVSIEVDGYDTDYVDEYFEDPLQFTDYGLRFDVDGNHPDGFGAGTRPVVPLVDDGGGLKFRWNDGETRAEPIDATITATWVDEYGREGPTSDPLHITHDGAGAFGGGCTTTGAGTTPAAVIVVLMLLALAVRRPRTCPCGHA